MCLKLWSEAWLCNGSKKIQNSDPKVLRRNISHHGWHCCTSGCIVLKSCIKPTLNVWWSPSILVLCMTPNFPTFILRTWNQTHFWQFWRAFRASRLRQIKKLHKTKCLCLLITFKCCFMQDPQLTNFNLANLKTVPFLVFWLARRAWGLRRIKKLNNTKYF